MLIYYSGDWETNPSVNGIGSFMKCGRSITVEKPSELALSQFTCIKSQPNPENVDRVCDGTWCL